MNKKFKNYSLALLGAVLFIVIATSDGKKETYQNAEATTTVKEEVIFANKDTSGKIEVAKDTVAESNVKQGDSKQSLSRGGVSLLDKEEVKKKVEDSKNTSQSQIQAVDWWKSGRYIFHVGATVEVEDVFTGKKFKVERTMGDNHADVETLAKEDTNILKSIWKGFSWERRPVILNIDGKKYAASMSAMPHAGLDSYPAYGMVNDRSGGYGRGQNLDVIKDNGMDGHVDIHFLNSTRHKDGKVDPQHQNAISKVPKSLN